MSEVQTVSFKEARLATRVDESTLDEMEQAISAMRVEAQEQARKNQLERAKSEQESADIVARAANIDDIIERAAAIADEVRFEHVVKKRMGDMLVATPENTDLNKRVVLDMLFSKCEPENRPRVDTFRNAVVDHRGVLLDESYDATDYLYAFEKAGLRKLKIKDAIEAVRAYALTLKQNDLIQRVEKMTPKEWDGVERMEKFFIDLFDIHDTPLNREFSRHFFMSFYGRMMYPGTDTGGLVLILVGAPGCGKSHVGKRFAQIVSGNPDADSVQLNLDSVKDPTEFLRDVTGQSVVASLGELSGLDRAQMDNVKNFVARTTDKFRQLYCGSSNHPRQWIAMGDSNRIGAILKEAEGNRRFYMMYCGQQESDHMGRPQWNPNYRSTVDMDSKQFERDFWFVMAEARHQWQTDGIKGYKALTKSVSVAVQNLSAELRDKGVGTATDPVAQRFLRSAIASAKITRQKERKAVFTVDGKQEEMHIPECYVLYLSELSLSLMDVAKRFRVNLERADEYALQWAREVGAVDARLTGRARALVFGIGKDGLCEKFEYRKLKDFTLDEDGMPHAVAARNDGEHWPAEQLEFRRMMIGLLGDDWEQIRVNRGGF